MVQIKDAIPSRFAIEYVLLGVQACCLAWSAHRYSDGAGGYYRLLFRPEERLTLLRFGRCSRSVVDGFRSAYLRVTKRPLIADLLRVMTLFFGLFAILLQVQHSAAG